MSMYTDCGRAARQLIDDPSLVDPTQYAGISGVFNELDVITITARDCGPFSDKDFVKAYHEASQVMRDLFNGEHTVRFGPVVIPGVDEPDYLRVDSKILYSAPDRHKTLKTPNGVFPQMFTTDDTIKRAGRRAGTNRNDLESWDLLAVRETPSTAEQREIIRLRAELSAALQKLEAAEAENHRLREHGAQALTAEAIASEVAKQLRAAA